MLKHNALFATFELPLTADVHTKKFIAFFNTHFKKVAPVHRWLVDSVL